MNLYEYENILYGQSDEYKKVLCNLEAMIVNGKNQIEKDRAFRFLNVLLQVHGARTSTSGYLLKQLAKEKNCDIITTGNLMHLGNCTSGNHDMSCSEGGSTDMASNHRETYTYTDAQGNACTIRFNGQSKKDTDHKFQAFLAQSAAPVSAVTVEKVHVKTLRQFIEEDYWTAFASGLRPNTANNYKFYQSKYILPFLGNLPLDHITVKDIQRFMDWMANGKDNGLKKNLAEDTINRVKGHLSYILTIAKDMRLISETPIKNKLLRNNGEKSEHHKAMLPEEYQEFRRNALALKHPKQQLYACMFAFTSMRREEVLGLKWEWVNLDEGYCQVKEVVTYSNGRTYVSPNPKTAASERTVILPPQLVEVMRKNVRPCGYVIASPRQPLQPMPYSTAKALYTKTFAELGINGKYSNHDCRATYAAWMKENGVPLDAAAEIMGHSDTRMMSHVYAPTRHQSIMVHKNTLNQLVETQLAAPE